MKLTSSGELFAEQVRALYTAENQLIVTLPRLAARAVGSPLRDLLLEHLGETQKQVMRLESIADQCSIRFGARPCRAMTGLLADGDDLIGGAGSPEVLLRALIGSCQEVEQYEVAAYRNAVRLAEQLQMEGAANLLSESLQEEINAREKLDALSMSLAAAA